MKYLKEHKSLKEDIDKIEQNQKIVDRFQKIFALYKKDGSPRNDKELTGVDQSVVDQIQNVIMNILNYIENGKMPKRYSKIKELES